MGHERIGMLPKTKRWRTIVSEVASSDLSKNSTAQIAAHTLTTLGSKYRELSTDQSVQTAFSFLIELSRSAGKQSAVDNAQNSPLSLIAELGDQLRKTKGSLETRELVRRAAADAIAIWHRENQAAQTDLFETTSTVNTWRGLSTGAGFCELSRLYFSRLTERYLNYFLDREASAVLPNIRAREEFEQRLHEHLADVSRLAFESSKIMQSYAAGWFNKYAKESIPTPGRQQKFLSYAFDKLREELRREGQQ